MKLSVIIITWNAQRDVKQCLDSILEAVAGYPSEIIITDNGSTDETLSIIKSYGERINLICLKENKGVAVARNIGLRAAKGEYIWILDVDTIVNQEAASGMLSYLVDHPECGLCSCRLHAENGEMQDSCRKFPWLKHKIRNIIAGKSDNPVLPQWFSNKIKQQNESQFYHKELQGKEPFEAEYVIGACQMFRKTILDEAGYLDEKIFYGPEDADFCLRICQKGYKIVCLPAYHIIHHYNRITNKKIFSKISYLHAKGLLHFYFKHSSIAQP